MCLLGYTEVTSAGKRDNEEGLHVCNNHYHLLLPLLWMLWVCSLREWHARESLDRIRVLWALLARWFCQCLHCSTPSRRISGNHYYVSVCLHNAWEHFNLSAQCLRCKKIYQPWGGSISTSIPSALCHMMRWDPNRTLCSPPKKKYLKNKFML